MIRVLVGIFVGGRSTRMGRPKGLLSAPSGERTLVERLAGCVREILPESPIVLVGANPDYVHLPYPQLPDHRPESGPLGGLVSLLREAQSTGREAVLALSCDLPFVSAAFLQRLTAENHDASALSPKNGAHFEPLCARYGVRCLSAAEKALDEGRLSLQQLLREIKAASLDVSDEERLLLRDWDTPEDVAETMRKQGSASR